MSKSATTAPAASPASNADRAWLRYIDWIWTIRGSLQLAPELSSDDAFHRLDPLFQEPGTSYTRDHDTLVFTKKDQAAQDKMSIFDCGTLNIDRTPGAVTLRWHLFSRALLFCFLAPLFFLALSQATVHFGKAPKPDAEATAEKTKKPEKQEPELKLHPLDLALGAPAPEKPKDKKTMTAKEKKAAADEKKPSPTPSYVFAGLFAALYIIGRILEAWLIKRQFRRRVFGV